MTNNQNQPNQYDAVLGGNAPPPIHGAVLGGIEGVKRRLASSNIEAQIAALNDALNYRDVGLDLLIETLQHESVEIQQSAYEILKIRKQPYVKQALDRYKIQDFKRRLASTDIGVQKAALDAAFSYGDKGLDIVIESLEHQSAQVRKYAAKFLNKLGHKKVKSALVKYKFWNKFEKYYEISCDYATKFANREIIEFDPKIGIDSTADNTYALRVGANKQTENIEKLQIFLRNPLINQVEALVLGHWYTSCLDVIDLLLDAQSQLTNLKALFVGDCNYLKENGFYAMLNYDISYILLVYQHLEVLHIRCTNCHRKSKDIFTLNISPIKHENLKALIIESNTNHDFINDFYNLELPALEYLELRMARREYDYYQFNQLMTVINTNFPKLKYLGLRNSCDELTFALINFPIIENLVELDMSAGTMTDMGAEALLNCPAIHQLDTLDISYNGINCEMIEKFKQLDINLIFKSNMPPDYNRFYPANE